MPRAASCSPIDCPGFTTLCTSVYHPRPNIRNCAARSSMPVGLTVRGRPASTRNRPFGCSTRYADTGSQMRAPLLSRRASAFAGQRHWALAGRFGATPIFPQCRTWIRI